MQKKRLSEENNYEQILKGDFEFDTKELIGTNLYSKIYKIEKIQTTKEINEQPQFFILKEDIVDNYNEFKEIQQDVDNNVKFKHEKLCNYIDWFPFEKEIDNNNYFYSYTLAEIYDQNLKHFYKKNKEKYENEQFILQQIDEILKILEFLKNKKMHHLNLNPYNIVFFGNQICLQNFGEARSLINNWKAKFHDLKSQLYYFSPIQRKNYDEFYKKYQELVEKKIKVHDFLLNSIYQQEKHSLEKDDIFSLGMIFLQMCLGLNNEQISKANIFGENQDFQEFQSFNEESEKYLYGEELVQFYLNEILEKKQFKELYFLLKNMLHFNEEKRYNIAQCQIRTRQQFLKWNYNTLKNLIKDLEIYCQKGCKRATKKGCEICDSLVNSVNKQIIDVYKISRKK